jgi:hypothetical protein
MRKDVIKEKIMKREPYFFETAKTCIESPKISLETIEILVEHGWIKFRDKHDFALRRSPCHALMCFVQEKGIKPQTTINPRKNMFFIAEKDIDNLMKVFMKDYPELAVAVKEAIEEQCPEKASFRSQLPQWM